MNKLQDKSANLGKSIFLNFVKTLMIRVILTCLRYTVTSFVCYRAAPFVLTLLCKNCFFI